MKKAAAGCSAASLTNVLQATLITMATSNEMNSSVIENARLVVRSDRIQAVCPNEVSFVFGIDLDRVRCVQLGLLADVPCPDGATDLDMTGNVILPGYIDAHAHWTGEELILLASVLLCS